MAKPTPADDWPEKPDRWAQEDKAWEAKWTDRPADEPHASYPEPSADYRPSTSTPESVAGGYGDGMRAAGSHLGFGLQIGVSMACFVGLGLVADQWLDSSPWGVIVGACLGMVGVMALVIRMARGGDT